MFLSAREGTKKPGGQALAGPVTLEGSPAGAYLEGERREISVYGPKGYYWVPKLGDEVLVLKTGQDGEKPCVVGAPMGEGRLKPGQVMISTGKAAVLLSPNGTVAVTGTFTVNGTVVGPEPPKTEGGGEEEES